MLRTISQAKLVSAARTRLRDDHDLPAQLVLPGRTPARVSRAEADANRQTARR